MAQRFLTFSCNSGERQPLVLICDTIFRKRQTVVDASLKSSRRKFLKSTALASGAAALGACTTGNQPLYTQRQTPTFYPKHNERTKGWLRFLWQKATTPDDWSYTGNEELPWGIKIPRGDIDFSDDGVGPNPWWDQYSGAPYLSYPRFDLSDSSYAVLLMADQTPAWREVYTRIMDELATRHTAYWAAIDWNTFIGPSPDRKNYPPQMMVGWPERLHGNYDFPGWTANGVAPHGLQRDPIGADGNLFFRGWLNLVLTIYKYVSGDDKWEKPWTIAGFENEHFQWTQPKIVEHLHQQYIDHPEGPHCENTKIWPLCNSAAGLGIYLSDQLGLTNAHGVFENWVEFARDNYLGINGANELEWSTLYYDPLEELKLNSPSPLNTIGTAFYLLPQSPEIATYLYDAAAKTAGWRDPRRQIQSSPHGLAVAKALGDHTAVARLSAAAERELEPRWFGENMEKFGWWSNLNEPWPRGQSSARMMITEIQEGNWADAFSVKNMDKYNAPSVEGVDFPTLGLDQAWNDKESGLLHVGTYAADSDRRGEETSWRITGIPNVDNVFILADGAEMQNFEVLNSNTIQIKSTVNDHRFQIFTGYHGQLTAQSTAPIESGVSNKEQYAARTRSAAENAKAAESAILSGAGNCPCCTSA